MLTSLDEVAARAAFPVSSERANVARGGSSIGRVGAAWYFSANTSIPHDSGLHQRVKDEGYLGPFMRPWLECLERVGRTTPRFDDVVYHLPFGADIGEAMPFEGQVVWSRFTRARRSFPLFVRNTTEQTTHLHVAGIMPAVYLGGLSSRAYWSPRSLHMALVSDSIYKSIEGLMDSTTGMPICRIAGDTFGVMGHATLEDTAAQILWRSGFEVIVEPRPAVWTLWALRERCASFTTDQLWRVTGEEGTGRGGNWAVPRSQMSGPCGILVIDGATTDEQLATWMASGADIYFPGYAWCQGNANAAAILRRVERVTERAAQIVESGQ